MRWCKTNFTMPAFRKYKILTDKGKISKQQAEAEYDEFNKTQRIISDFDKEIKKIAKGGSDE